MGTSRQLMAGRQFGAGLVWFGLAAARLVADVTLAPVFADHAVLQRDQPVPVWGRADPGERVTVRFGEHLAESRADPAGHWVVRLGPLPASRSGRDLQVEGTNAVTIRDVLVGDVWLCAGQSNMNRSVAASAGAEAEIAAASYPLIRHTRAPVGGSSARWRPTSPRNVGPVTAVGYAFARTVFEATGVPIGLIQASVGGTPIEAWMSPATLPVPARPEGATGRSPRHQAGRAYSRMIEPLIPYALGGILWYQGEADAARAQDYARRFQTLITDWRERFGRADLPFYWVQLPNFAARDPTGRRWAWLREAQAQALVLPHTEMAVTIDLGEVHNSHPANKRDVGHRLALIALARVYGRPVVHEGPRVAAVRVRDGTLRVQFAGADGGLRNHGAVVEALELAGADRRFRPAQGRLEGDVLVVTSSEVPDPVAVRYAWTNAPRATLYGEAGLPVAPFRSDNW